MKRLAKILIPAVLMASAILVAGHSSASSNNDCVFEPAVQLSERKGDADKRKEFWDKFRESVTPRENKPRQQNSPREIPPKAVR